MPPSSTFNNLPSQKQERILDEALSEFAAKGYARASVNRLVARLGIAKGSIFQYFRDKPGLFQQVFDFAVERVKGHLRGVRESTRGQDVFSRLEQSLLAGLVLIEKNPRLFQFYLHMLFEGDVPFRGRLLGSIRIFSHEYLMDLLRDGAAAGELRPGLDLEMAAFAVDATLERFLIASVVEHMDPGLGLHQVPRQPAAELAARLVDTLRHGLGRGAVSLWLLSVAMPQEAGLLLACLRPSEPIGGRPVYQGGLAGREVLLVLTGLGQVNAAQAITAVLETRPRVDAVLNLGCAGAYENGGLDLGQAALADEVIFRGPGGE